MASATRSWIASNDSAVFDTVATDVAEHYLAAEESAVVTLCDLAQVPAGAIEPVCADACVVADPESRATER